MQKLESVTCANCQEQYMHQVGFIWWQRVEDAEEGTAYFVEQGGNSGSYKFTNSGSGNSSARRHSSMNIFHCECCHEFTGIAFSQHKGATFVASHIVSSNFTVKKLNLMADSCGGF